jgi:GGDEF domain-containing protein
VRRLSDSVGTGSVHRLGPGEFALVLSGATADDAEALLGTLHMQGTSDDAGEIVLSAGITELVERDGAETALGRAEHALWQAKQAGRGTIVVAVAGRRTPRFE